MLQSIHSLRLFPKNIKWNKQINSKKIKALLINTRNANAFTGKDGFQGLKDIAEELSMQLQIRKRMMKIRES